MAGQQFGWVHRIYAQRCDEKLITTIEIVIFQKLSPLKFEKICNLNPYIQFTLLLMIGWQVNGFMKLSVSRKLKLLHGHHYVMAGVGFIESIYLYFRIEKVEILH